MINLLLCIFLNVALVALFKVFPRYGIDSRQAIVYNYLVCVITGCLFMKGVPVSAQSSAQPWFPYAVLMGLGFICIFNLLSYCTRIDGITTSTIANKLSLVIPVIFSVVLYHESTEAVKIAGILLAFPAVYLTTRVKEGRRKQNLVLPVILFLGSGLLDTLVKYTERNFLPTSSIQISFAIHVFAVASIAGILLLVILRLRNKLHFEWKNLIAGICLGIPNFFSIYFFICLLHSDLLQSSAAIPVNNMGILLLSAVVAIGFFKEKLSISRLIGLLLSVSSILLIASSDK